MSGMNNQNSKQSEPPSQNYANLAPVVYNPDPQVILSSNRNEYGNSNITNGIVNQNEGKYNPQWQGKGGYDKNQNVYQPSGPDVNPMGIDVAYQPKPQPIGPIIQNRQPNSPYPQHAPADVQRAVQGEKRWKGTN